MPAMNGTDSTPCGGSTGSDEVIQVTSERHVYELAANILNPDRYYSIICLTARVGGSAPALDPERVRSIVGPYIPIYVIIRFFPGAAIREASTGRKSTELAQLAL